MRLKSIERKANECSISDERRERGETEMETTERKSLSV